MDELHHHSQLPGGRDADAHQLADLVRAHDRPRQGQLWHHRGPGHHGVRHAPGPGGLPAAGLFTQATADGLTVRYHRVGSGSAAVVAEGAVEPDAQISTVAVDAARIKIASLLP